MAPTLRVRADKVAALPKVQPKRGPKTNKRGPGRPRKFPPNDVTVPAKLAKKRGRKPKNKNQGKSKKTKESQVVFTKPVSTVRKPPRDRQSEPTVNRVRTQRARQTQSGGNKANSRNIERASQVLPTQLYPVGKNVDIQAPVVSHVNKHGDYAGFAQPNINVKQEVVEGDNTPNSEQWPYSTPESDEQWLNRYKTTTSNGNSGPGSFQNQYGNDPSAEEGSSSLRHYRNESLLNQVAERMTGASPQPSTAPKMGNDTNSPNGTDANQGQAPTLLWTPKLAEAEFHQTSAHNSSVPVTSALMTNGSEHHRAARAISLTSDLPQATAGTSNQLPFPARLMAGEDVHGPRSLQASPTNQPVQAREESSSSNDRSNAHSKEAGPSNHNN